MQKFRTPNMYRAIEDTDELENISEAWWKEEAQWNDVANRASSASNREYAERMAKGCYAQQEFIGQIVRERLS